MSNKKTVPSLRFRGFSEPWEEKEFTEFVNFFTGLTYKPSDIQKKGVLVLRSSNINNGEIVDADNVYVNPQVINSDNVREGDIIIVVRNGSRSLIGKHAQVKCPMPNTVIGAFMAGIRSECPVFTNALLNTSRFDEEISINMGATINQITGYMFSKMKFIVPCYEEQKAIGSYFEHLDRLIALEQQRYDKLNTVKKSMLEKMFPQKGAKVPEIRFKGFSEPWEEKKLKDFGKATGGTSIESEFITNGKYKVISIGSYSETSQYTDQGIRANKTKKTENRILKKNDLTMILNDKTTSGNIIGRVLLIDADDFYVYNQRTERIEVNLNMFEPDFLYQLLNADNIRSKIIKAAQGNTQIYVNWTTICEFSYRIPCSKLEQKQIADYFQNLDRLITLQNRKIEKLRNLKKACLEKMFV